MNSYTKIRPNTKISDILNDKNKVFPDRKYTICIDNGIEKFVSDKTEYFKGIFHLDSDLSNAILLGDRDLKIYLRWLQTHTIGLDFKVYEVVRTAVYETVLDNVFKTVTYGTSGGRLIDPSDEINYTVLEPKIAEYPELVSSSIMGLAEYKSKNLTDISSIKIVLTSKLNVPHLDKLIEFEFCNFQKIFQTDFITYCDYHVNCYLQIESLPNISEIDKILNYNFVECLKINTVEYCGKELFNFFLTYSYICNNIIEIANLLIKEFSELSLDVEVN